MKIARRECFGVEPPPSPGSMNAGEKEAPPSIACVEKGSTGLEEIHVVGISLSLFARLAV
jgi:hypothetical protein